MLIKFAVSLICITWVGPTRSQFLDNQELILERNGLQDCEGASCKAQEDALSSNLKAKSCNDTDIIIQTLETLLRVLNQNSPKSKNAALALLKERLISISRILERNDEIDEIYLNPDVDKPLLRNRNMKTKVTVQFDLPNIKRPQCKEAFDNLIDAEHRAYINLSKHPICTVNGQSVKIRYKKTEAGDHNDMEHEQISHLDPNYLLNYKDYYDRRNIEQLQKGLQNNKPRNEKISPAFGLDAINNYNNAHNLYPNAGMLKYWDPRYKNPNLPFNKYSINSIDNRLIKGETNKDKIHFLNPLYSPQNIIKPNVLNYNSLQKENPILGIGQFYQNQKYPKSLNSIYHELHNLKQPDYNIIPGNINMKKTPYANEYTDPNALDKHYLNYKEFNDHIAAFSKKVAPKFNGYVVNPAIKDAISVHGDEYIPSQGSYPNIPPIATIGNRRPSYVHKYISNLIQPRNPVLQKSNLDFNHNHPSQSLYASNRNIPYSYDVNNFNLHNPIIGNTKPYSNNYSPNANNAYLNNLKLKQPYYDIGNRNIFKPHDLNVAGSDPDNLFAINYFDRNRKPFVGVEYNPNNVNPRNTISNEFFNLPNTILPQHENRPTNAYSSHNDYMNYFNNLNPNIPSLPYNSLKQNLITHNNAMLELTYVVKKNHPLVYHPIYIVKYRIPYNTFVQNYQQLLIQKPALKNNPQKLYQEVIALSNVTDKLRDYPEENLLSLAEKDGSLVTAKLVRDDSGLNKESIVFSKLDSKHPMDINQNNENEFYAHPNIASHMGFRRSDTIDSTQSNSNPESRSQTDQKKDETVTEKDSENVKSNILDDAHLNAVNTPNNNTVIPASKSSSNVNHKDKIVSVEPLVVDSDNNEERSTVDSLTTQR